MGPTRRDFLKAAGAGAAWVALGGSLAGASGCESAKVVRASAAPARAGRSWAFRTRPDLRPPVIEVTAPARDTAPGYLFCAPKNGPGEAHASQDGCLILDDAGQPVWFRPVPEKMDVMDFKVQLYRGERVLTWWEGEHTSYGQGEYLLMDGSYREVGRVRAGNGLEGDHHEFLISPEDTALFTIYHKVTMDLSSFGGSRYATVIDGIAQEVDVETGEVLFEWHSLDHVGLEESYTKPYDYFHINSIDVDLDGNLIVSSRTTSTVYKIDRETGEVIWRLGGKNSDFEMGEGTRTTFQHDARRQPDGTITIFDNGNMNEVERSRGIVLDLDEEAMTATLVLEYTHPEDVLSATQGNLQDLPNGNVFVGWGSAPALSEFDRDGRLLFDARFPQEGESYRVFRFPWNGQPRDTPVIAAEAGPDDEVTVYASWNGATQVAEWEVLAGPQADQLQPIGSAPRKGFETAITVSTEEPYIAVRARDASGRELDSSDAVASRSR